MKKILIVDDEQSVLFGMPKAIHKLCDFQGEIKTAKNGEDAIKEITNYSYDICFLDLHLPDVDSIEIIKKIKEMSPKTRVVIMTADVITDDLKRTIEENGASLLIEKPIDLYEITAFIKHALEGNGGLYEDQKFYRKDFIEERRSFERILFNKPIYYFVHMNVPGRDVPDGELKLHMKAVITDVSSGGMSIRTDYPLEHDQHLTFDNVLGHTNGVVKWSTEVDNNYRVGIMFI